MRTKIYRLPLACFLILVGPLFVFAQGGFSDADSNSDQQVDVDELKAYVSSKLDDFERFEQLMKELDTDKNGTLSESEFAKRMAAVQKIMSSPNSEPAQNDEADEKEGVIEFVDRYEKMFADRNPKLGEDLPDASAFDENGKPFELKQTRGKFTVIVFGCLT